MKLKCSLLLLFIVALTSCNDSSFNNENRISRDNSLLILNIEKDLFEQINTYRKEIGLTILTSNNEADKSANEHTTYMVSEGKISHDSFNSRASSLAEDTNAIVIKENVAKNYKTAEEAINGWLNSEAHKNTIEGDFTHTGISIKADEKGVLYFTQLFLKK